MVDPAKGSDRAGSCYASALIAADTIISALGRVGLLPYGNWDVRDRSKKEARVSGAIDRGQFQGIDKQQLSPPD